MNIIARQTYTRNLNTFCSSIVSCCSAILLNYFNFITVNSLLLCINKRS